MTIQAQKFIPRNYDVFAGLDVDKRSMSVIFTDHQQLMQSLRLPYSAAQLLSYVRPPASASTMSWWPAAILA